MHSLIRKFNIGLWGFLGLAVCLSCFGLLIESLPKGHDLVFHLSRIESLAKGLQRGDFWFKFIQIILMDTAMILISYEGTPPQKITEMMSFMSLIGFTIIIGRYY